MKNINELSIPQKQFINNLPYQTVTEVKGSLYYKLTGYHANGEKLENLVPKGYKATGLLQIWSEIMYTSINIIRLIKE